VSKADLNTRIYRFVFTTDALAQQGPDQLHAPTQGLTLCTPQIIPLKSFGNIMENGIRLSCLFKTHFYTRINICIWIITPAIICQSFNQSIIISSFLVRLLQ